MFEMEFKFFKFLSIMLKALRLGMSEPTKQLAAQITAYICVTDNVNRYLRQLMTFQYLKVASYI